MSILAGKVTPDVQYKLATVAVMNQFSDVEVGNLTNDFLAGGDVDPHFLTAQSNMLTWVQKMFDDALLENNLTGALTRSVPNTAIEFNDLVSFIDAQYALAGDVAADQVLCTEGRVWANPAALILSTQAGIADALATADAAAAATA